MSSVNPRGIKASEYLNSRRDQTAPLRGCIAWAKECFIEPHMVVFNAEAHPVRKKKVGAASVPTTLSKVPGVGILDRAADVVRMLVKAKKILLVKELTL